MANDSQAARKSSLLYLSSELLDSIFELVRQVKKHGAIATDERIGQAYFASNDSVNYSSE